MSKISGALIEIVTTRGERRGNDKHIKTAKLLTSFTTPPKQLDSRRRRQPDVDSPGEVMRSKPRPSLNRSTAAASSWKVLVLKLPTGVQGAYVSTLFPLPLRKKRFSDCYTELTGIIPFDDAFHNQCSISFGYFEKRQKLGEKPR